MLALAFVALGCSGTTDEAAEPEGAENGTDVTQSEQDADAQDASGEDRPGVESSALAADGQPVAPAPDGPAVELVVLSEDPLVTAAVYPRPDYEANPWSQWGQGIVLDDGRVITAIGDHLGVDGNSFLFVYDPGSQTLTRFADVLSAINHETGSWGYGKIHSQMVDPGGDAIFFTTYYGSRRDLRFDGTYQGDVLLSLNKETLELEPVSVPAPEHGVPSLASNGDGLVYGEAVDPLLDDDTYPAGGFFVFDTETSELVRFQEEPDHIQFRNVMVANDGTAWFAHSDGSLFQYSPSADEVTLPGFDLGSPLRASTAPTSDGTIYGVTDDPFRFFAFEPGNGEVRSLGQPERYTTSMALLPDESGFLYVPGAHGDAYRWQSSLIAVDGASGEKTTIVELYDLVKSELGLVLGGTYSVTVDDARNTAYVGFNAGQTEDDPWGEVVFVSVELP